MLSFAAHEGGNTGERDRHIAAKPGRDSSSMCGIDAPELRQETQGRSRIRRTAANSGSHRQPFFQDYVSALVRSRRRLQGPRAFPALNARPGPVLHEWLDRITSELADHPGAAPYAVNQIVHKSNDRLEHDVEACVKYKVPVVITSLGAQTWLNDAIHSYGGIVLHDIINIAHAKKALEKGAEFRQPMAVAVIGGLITSTILSLVLVPVVYEFVDDFENWLRPKLAKLVTPRDAPAVTAPEDRF